MEDKEKTKGRVALAVEQSVTEPDSLSTASSFPPGMAEQALMAVTDPMNILDRQFRIVWANDVRARMHQRSLEEMQGRYCYEMFQRRSESCEGCPVAETLRTGKPCTRERFADRPDGVRVWSETHAWPIFASNGEITHVVEYARDITRFKQAEEALRKSERELRILSSQLLIAQEKERKRVAQELHDGVGQALTAIKFKLRDILEQLDLAVMGEIADSLQTVIPLTQEPVPQTILQAGEI